MPGTETLQRVQSIVDALTPLTAAAPGDPLRSQDWNRIVGAVVELAQLALAREQALDDALSARFAALEHAHEGQVDESWFAAATRERFEGRSAPDASLQRDVQATRSAVDALRKDLDGVRSQLAALQRHVDALDDSGSALNGGLQRFEKRLETFNDLRDSLQATSKRFDVLQGDVGKALALGAKLVDSSGSAVDFGALQTRVGQLETLRENLISSDGSLGRFRTLEARLAAFEVDRLKSSDLDDRIKLQLKNVAGLDDGPLADGLLAKTTARIDERVATLKTQLAAVESNVTGARGDLVAQRNDLNGLSTRVAAAEGQTARIGTLAGDVDGLKTRVTGVESRSADNATVLAGFKTVPQLIDALDARLGGVEALGPRINKLETTVTSHTSQLTLFSDFQGRVNSLEALRGEFATNATRVSKLELAASSLAGDVAGLQQRAVVVEAQTSDARNRVTQLEQTTTAQSKSLQFLSSDVTSLKSNVSSLQSVSSRLDVIERAGSVSSGGSVFRITRPNG